MIAHNDGGSWMSCVCDECQRMASVYRYQWRKKEMKIPQGNESGEFEKCPPGNHLAVCYEVIDLGTQEVVWKGTTKLQRKIWVGWEIPEETMDDGRPFVVGRRYTLSGSEKSNLRKDLESWRGKAFTDEEMGPDGTFEIQNVIGAGCLLNVVHAENDGKTYANITSVAPLPRGMPAPTLTNREVYLSLDPEEFDSDTFEGLSERMKETIRKSPEWKPLETNYTEQQF